MNECSDYALVERVMEGFLNDMISFVESLTLLRSQGHRFDALALCAPRLPLDITIDHLMKKLAQGLL